MTEPHCPACECADADLAEGMADLAAAITEAIEAERANQNERQPARNSYLLTDEEWKSLETLAAAHATTPRLLLRQAMTEWVAAHATVIEHPI